MLTGGWTALCGYRHLSHLTPCCPAYPSAPPPPLKTQIIYIKVIKVKKCCLLARYVAFILCFHLTCLKLPFFLCSQSIISWKIGIIIFRISGWGTRVTPRKGPIIPGMKWGLFSPETHEIPRESRPQNEKCLPVMWAKLGLSECAYAPAAPNFCHMLHSSYAIITLMSLYLRRKGEINCVNNTLNENVHAWILRWFRTCRGFSFSSRGRELPAADWAGWCTEQQGWRRSSTPDTERGIDWLWKGAW